MSTTHRIRFLNQYYTAGNRDASTINDIADEIINQPDAHLLSQADLVQAEGGYNTLALSLGLAAVGALALFGANPRIASHLKNGNLSFYEWLALGGTTTVGYWTGHHAGVLTFGDVTKYQAHWMAYTFVKAQNRFEGRQLLSKAPYY